MAYKNILVTTDLTDDSVSALKDAVYESVSEETKITFLHVFKEYAPPFELGTEVWTPESAEKLKKDYLSKAQEKLDGIVNDVFCTLFVEAVVVPSGGQSVHEVIRDFASNNRCDMIMAVVHRLGTIESLMVGKTIQRLLRDTPCKVLIVPGNEPARD